MRFTIDPVDRPALHTLSGGVYECHMRLEKGIVPAVI